ncbi:hypothetical protein [Aquimarina sp. SS2-1]|uniref:hypothetical protein n=1 Tax=Aquimarina besae TaxID=3342247 RepID=UPI003671E915
MKKILLLSILITSFSFSQQPNYSDLSRIDKLKLMNYYGFLITKTEDTVIAKIELNKGTNVPIVTENSEIFLEYPKELQKYKYVEKIDLRLLDKFYFGLPRRFNVIRKYDSTYINLEVIEEKKYRIYRRNEIGTAYNNGLHNNTGGFTYSQSYNAEFKILYIAKENGDLIRIDGTPREKKAKLTELLKNELDEKELKRIRTRNDKIIELFKKLNLE